MTVVAENENKKKIAGIRYIIIVLFRRRLMLLLHIIFRHIVCSQTYRNQTILWTLK